MPLVVEGIEQWDGLNWKVGNAKLVGGSGWFYEFSEVVGLFSDSVSREVGVPVGLIRFEVFWNWRSVRISMNCGIAVRAAGVEFGLVGVGAFAGGVFDWSCVLGCHELAGGLK